MYLSIQTILTIFQVVLLLHRCEEARSGFTTFWSHPHRYVSNYKNIPSYNFFWYCIGYS